MGPMWFYEGFACYVAEQYSEAPLPSNSEIEEILKKENRGNYKSYAPMVRKLANAKTIVELLRQARDSNFNKNTKEILTGKAF